MIIDSCQIIFQVRQNFDVEKGDVSGVPRSIRLLFLTQQVAQCHTGIHSLSCFPVGWMRELEGEKKKTTK